VAECLKYEGTRCSTQFPVPLRIEAQLPSLLFSPGGGRVRFGLDRQSPTARSVGCTYSLGRSSSRCDRLLRSSVARPQGMNYEPKMQQVWLRKNHSVRRHD